MVRITLFEALRIQRFLTTLFIRTAGPTNVFRRQKLAGWYCCLPPVSYCLLLALIVAFTGCGDSHTTDGKCPEERTKCGEFCVDVGSDPMHCGECFVECSVSNGTPACLDGSCSIYSCTTPHDDCDGSYENGCEADLGIDPVNCGGCGNTCTENQACENGTCVVSCSVGLTNCSDSCVDTKNDTSNCGSCGKECIVSNGTPECSNGSCIIDSCTTPYNDCDSTYENGCEVDMSIDTSNCGGCDNICSASQACENGVCVAACTGGLTNCNGTCVDTDTDTNNCGGCDIVCTVVNGTPECSSASCAIAHCNTPYEDCDNSYENGCESNTYQDPTNCGVCGIVCNVAEGEVCLNGSCETDCGNLTNCNGSCVDTQTDRSNCGTCSNVCEYVNGTGVCFDGTCWLNACNDGFADCNWNESDGCETQLGTDNDCSGCEDECTFPNGSGACTNGTCELVECDAGFADCNASSNDGCETQLGTITNCSVCGDECVYENATSACNRGTCEMDSCNTGFADCNVNDSDGCETRLGTVNDCSACGESCLGNQVCENGLCVGACSGGFTDCNGTCVDIDNDPEHCGNCNNSCTVANGTPGCLGGSCFIESCTSPYDDCDGLVSDGCEADIFFDLDNCGECEMVCPDPYPNDPCTGCIVGFCRMKEGGPEKVNCDGDCSNGWETNILTDPMNCGDCGIECSVSQDCVNGICQ